MQRPDLQFMVLIGARRCWCGCQYLMCRQERSTNKSECKCDHHCISLESTSSRESCSRMNREGLSHVVLRLCRRLFCVEMYPISELSLRCDASRQYAVMSKLEVLLYYYYHINIVIVGGYWYGIAVRVVVQGSFKGV